MERFGNPLVRSLKEKHHSVSQSNTVSIQGVTAKTFNVLAVLGLAFSLVWVFYEKVPPAVAFGAVFVGLALGLFISFKQSCNPALIYTYAVVQGVFLSVISRFFENMYSGIVIQALIGVLGCFLAVLFLYRKKIIRPTAFFKSFISTAILGILFIYAASFIGSFLGWTMPILHEASPAGIVLSCVIVAVASLSLVMDFKAIEDAEGQVPFQFEWFFAFSLMVTIVWMYIEILKLLWKIRASSE